MLGQQDVRYEGAKRKKPVCQECRSTSGLVFSDSSFTSRAIDRRGIDAAWRDLSHRENPPPPSGEPSPIFSRRSCPKICFATAGGRKGRKEGRKASRPAAICRDRCNDKSKEIQVQFVRFSSFSPYYYHCGNRIMRQSARSPSRVRSS